MISTRRSTCVFVTCVAMLLARAPAARQSPDRAAIAGEWQAAIGKQHLVLKIDQAPDSTLKGTIVSVDEGNASVPVDSLSVDAAGVVRVAVTGAGASYEGKLSADGREISGIWRQAGTSIAVLFRRPGAVAGAFTLKPTTRGRIALEPCRANEGAGSEGLCGTYAVYEHRASRDGRRIGLNILILPSTAAAPAPDPVFALAGGPGESATEAFPLTGFVARLRETRDVVLVDQRGTGKSNPLRCRLQSPDDAQAVLGEPFSLEKIRQCRADSDKAADTTQYTTSVAADDLDEVREALGYDRINVFGGSYGTKAALVYLRRHGGHVRTLTLEAVASPRFLIPLPFARGLQSAVNGLFDLCDANAACHAAYPDLRRKFAALVARLTETPARFTIEGQEITMSREMFLSKLRSVLYIPQFVSAFPLMLERAYGGDWRPYASAVLRVAAAIEAAVARGATFAAICAEDVPALTSAAIRRDTSGTYLGDSQIRRYREFCRAWGPAGPTPAGFHAPVRSRVPALLIAGALDPATPPATARDAASSLTNSRVVVVPEGTHGTGSACVDRLIAEFVIRGSAKDLDASCTAEVHLPPFVTR